MNRVLLMGNLGQDAELKVTQGGASVLKFSVATSEKWTGKDGQKQEKTSWHRCQMWGERAAKLAPYLSKGTKVLVEGSIEYGSYDKDGVKHYTTDIKVFNVEFAGGGNGKKSDSDAQSDTSSDDDGLPPVGDGEIPF